MKRIFTLTISFLLASVFLTSCIRETIYENNECSCNHQAPQSIVYGNFSATGTRDFYNRSSGIVYTGTVTDYWMSYVDAQYALDYYCPVGKGATREFKKAVSLKK